MIVSYTVKYLPTLERIVARLPIPQEEIYQAKCDFNLSTQRYVDTADEEDVVDLSAVNRTLVEIEGTIQRATARHNQFLRELGLPELP